METPLPRKKRQLQSELREMGFYEDTDAGKSSHTFWIDAGDPTNRVMFSGSDGDDAPPYLEKNVRAAIARKIARKERA